MAKTIQFGLQSLLYKSAETMFKHAHREVKKREMVVTLRSIAIFFLRHSKSLHDLQFAHWYINMLAGEFCLC
jgi:hypothetical protein